LLQTQNVEPLAMYAPHTFNPLNVYFWPFFIHSAL
jgi:hypothetical protein